MTPEENLAQLRAENLELKEALLDIVNQACQVEVVDGRCLVLGNHSACEDSIELMERLGLAKAVPGRMGVWELIWPERLKLSADR